MGSNFGRSRRNVVSRPGQASAPQDMRGGQHREAKQPYGTRPAALASARRSPDLRSPLPSAGERRVLGIWLAKTPLKLKKIYIVMTATETHAGTLTFLPFLMIST